jgi:hypothetical protein
VSEQIVGRGIPRKGLNGTAKRRAASPYISHYLCMIGQICDETRLLFCRCGMPWHLETRECLNDYLTNAAWITRCGDVCQTGEARALAAAARRLAAQPQVWDAGHADAIATLMRWGLRASVPYCQ